MGTSANIIAKYDSDVVGEDTDLCIMTNIHYDGYVYNGVGDYLRGLIKEFGTDSIFELIETSGYYSSLDPEKTIEENYNSSADKDQAAIVMSTYMIRQSRLHADYTYVMEKDGTINVYKLIYGGNGKPNVIFLNRLSELTKGQKNDSE